MRKQTALHSCQRTALLLWGHRAGFRARARWRTGNRLTTNRAEDQVGLKELTPWPGLAAAASPSRPLSQRVSSEEFGLMGAECIEVFPSQPLPTSG
ncbi:hypothetical protein ACOMHN_041271 [Nucella lapillus]